MERCARAVRVKEVLPNFDGRQLDYLIDFLTYAALPILLLWRAEILPAGQGPWLLAPLLAGAYWFCQVEAKTADGYFLGFPSHWNVVAFYLYALHFHVVPLPGWLSIGVLLMLSLLTLVPSRYLYTVHRGTTQPVEQRAGRLLGRRAVVDCLPHAVRRLVHRQVVGRQQRCVVGGSDPAVAAVSRVLSGDVLGHQLAMKDAT